MRISKEERQKIISVFGERKKCVGCGDDDFSANDGIYSLKYGGNAKIELCWECTKSVVESYFLRCGGKSFFNQEPETPQEKTYKKEKINGKLRIQVFERDAYRCLHCGTHIDLCVDHIYPESLGGKAVLENLQTLCRSCNSKKRKKHE